MKMLFFRQRSLMFFAVVFVAGLLSGCAQGTAFQSGNEPPKADYEFGKDLLNQVFSVYRSYSRDSIDRIVSMDFNPMRSEFVNRVERGFYGAQQIDLYPIVDSVVTNHDLVSVTFHWEKKVATYSGGNYKNLSGRAEYVFKNENGSWKIYQARGDDPMAMN